MDTEQATARGDCPMSPLSTVMVFLIQLSLVGDTNAETTPKPFVPNPAILTYIDEVITGVRTVTEQNPKRKALDVLIELAKGDKAEVFAHMLYQAALGAQSGKYNNDTQMGCIYGVHPIWAEMKNEERLEVLARLLMNHENIASQQAAWMYLPSYEQECCNGLSKGVDQEGIDSVCLKAFAPSIEGKLNSVSPATTAIVDYLIQRSATASLKFLLPLSGTPPEGQKTWLEVNQFVEIYYREVRKSYFYLGSEERISSSTKVTEEQVSQLAALCDGASWWQKIYLAEVIRFVPFLSSEKLVNSLKVSKEPLVLLSLEAAKLEAEQDKAPRCARWETLARSKKENALAVPK